MDLILSVLEPDIVVRSPSYYWVIDIAYVCEDFLPDMRRILLVAFTIIYTLLQKHG